MLTERRYRLAVRTSGLEAKRPCRETCGVGWQEPKIAKGSSCLCDRPRQGHCAWRNLRFLRRWSRQRGSCSSLHPPTDRVRLIFEYLALQVSRTRLMMPTCDISAVPD